MDLGLTDQVYVLTGASRGLGFATAACLVADGARVVLAARDAAGLAAAVERLGGSDHAVAVPADLAAPDTAERLVAAATDRFGRFDGALVSVGGPRPAAATAVDDQQWRDAFETVFLGTVRAVRTFADAAPAGGAVAVVLSTSARMPLPGLGVSNGFRPGLAAVVKEFADGYARRGVRLVSLLPGRIMTDRNVELFTAAADPQRARADAEAAIPLGRLGEPTEFGRVAAFVLSPAASYLTGLAIPVDGGALPYP
ncbi:SDR family oxidoreductase [Micromonospora sp. LOL_023]|uniref:SDR family oxidoreductase n=1 Tax=Micromonospora sp. LOL_023 TaxID=3345418 RepID=UPI003A87010D